MGNQLLSLRVFQPIVALSIGVVGVDITRGWCGCHHAPAGSRRTLAGFGLSPIRVGATPPIASTVHQALDV